jgi:hypothetical protein
LSGTIEMPERPTGTVTFLFTDIEESTRLLYRLRDRYGDVLSRRAGLGGRPDAVGLDRGHRPVGAQPAAMASGAGARWVANLRDQSVTRVDPALADAVVRVDTGTNAVANPTPVGTGPAALLATPAAIWVANAGTARSCGSIRTPATWGTKVYQPVYGIDLAALCLRR